VGARVTPQDQLLVEEYELEVAHEPRQPGLDMLFDAGQAFVRGGISFKLLAHLHPLIRKSGAVVLFGGSRPGQAHDELTPLAKTRAAGAYVAPMHLDDLADQRQAEPQPTRGVIGSR